MSESSLCLHWARGGLVPRALTAEPYSRSHESARHGGEGLRTKVCVCVCVYVSVSVSVFV